MVVHSGRREEEEENAQSESLLRLELDSFFPLLEGIFIGVGVSSESLFI